MPPPREASAVFDILDGALNGEGEYLGLSLSSAPHWLDGPGQVTPAFYLSFCIESKGRSSFLSSPGELQQLGHLCDRVLKKPAAVFVSNAQGLPLKVSLPLTLN